MKHEKVKPNKGAVESNRQASGPSLEELQRSHHILEALIATLPPRPKKSSSICCKLLPKVTNHKKPIVPCISEPCRLCPISASRTRLKRSRARDVSKKWAKDGRLTGGKNKIRHITAKLTQSKVPPLLGIANKPLIVTCPALPRGG